jgi:hypothetical protein
MSVISRRQKRSQGRMASYRGSSGVIFGFSGLDRMTTRMDEAAECGKRCVQVLAWLQQPVCQRSSTDRDYSSKASFTPPSSHIDRTRDEVQVLLMHVERSKSERAFTSRKGCWLVLLEQVRSVSFGRTTTLESVIGTQQNQDTQNNRSFE